MEKAQNDIHPKSQWSVLKNVKRHIGSKSKGKNDRQMSVEIPPAPSVTVNSASLIGKVAIVTGSSRSTGAAIAKALGEQGANVVVNYLHSEEEASKVVQAVRAQGRGAVAIRSDVSSLDGVRHLVNEAMRAFGKIDILVLNAGIMKSKPLAEVDEEFFDAHIDFNVKAPLFFVKAASSYLPSRESE
ncbi:hypothetical protein AX14_004393 [Amanita brunnescens Koide BX004]|nr:hypothetical protein AX14_004393 [Amanita brunnescens Koide BX004]